jgi:hypothetical protein
MPRGGNGGEASGCVPWSCVMLSLLGSEYVSAWMDIVAQLKSTVSLTLVRSSTRYGGVCTPGRGPSTIS